MDGQFHHRTLHFLSGKQFRLEMKLLACHIATAAATLTSLILVTIVRAQLLTFCMRLVASLARNLPRILEATGKVDPANGSRYTLPAATFF